MSLQHTVLPTSHHWVSLLVRYVEDHMWEDSERAGDLWNGRWTRHTLEDVLLEHSDSMIPLAEYTRALELAHPTNTLTSEGPDGLVFRSEADLETDHHSSAFPRHTTKNTTESTGSPHADAFFGMAHTILQRHKPP